MPADRCTESGQSEIPIHSSALRPVADNVKTECVIRFPEFSKNRRQLVSPLGLLDSSYKDQPNRLGKRPRGGVRTRRNHLLLPEARIEKSVNVGPRPAGSAVDSYCTMVQSVPEHPSLQGI